ncbi:arginine N-succinyltransferase [Pectobacteriaceae bacterium CE70]|uniref:Arginine N-succinyltransferase n=1 Tax=Serratia sp. (strain ATCC 39006) TaxID=104623 RepID=A0A2I5TFX5_SERS3|nr:arginine N-succinyltransferase [Serratia sp. ATCC 39006]AUG99144.1 arginine N-succinyltransferase [Serratia sp. ATCC 39006]AUH03460.1 arginine N-succinyltransferase [Serratia sp. ATCC 39006]WJV66544.1 arginine N-succinyltransferase [Pectobacteriaceae bacterium CE70]WJY10549.1 arginine N-succinyltransferase [Pectobacteriaceae bacterium C80]
MMIIRPVEQSDLPDLLVLAGKSGVGLTSLPKNEQTLATRIARTICTRQGEVPPGEQGYWFVLEDTVTGRVVGVSALEVAVGLSEPWYSFRLGTLVHASKALGVYKSMQTLTLVHDYTGSSELCTLFLDPDYRHGSNGKLLSKVRFLFIAAFREHFSRKLFAEMRGYSDENGNSPFWDSVGNHFFSIDFAKADYLSGTGQKAFIAELMPKHPLYVDLLAPGAREAIGSVHPHTMPARTVLESEGLRYNGYVDIFDGGPTLDAEIDDLRAVRHSRLLPIVIMDHPCAVPHLPQCLVANDNYHHYRALLVHADPMSDQLPLSLDAARALGVVSGDRIRLLPLIPQEKF